MSKKEVDTDSNQGQKENMKVDKDGKEKGQENKKSKKKKKPKKPLPPEVG